MKYVFRGLRGRVWNARWAVVCMCVSLSFYMFISTMKTHLLHQPFATINQKQHNNKPTNRQKCIVQDHSFNVTQDQVETILCYYDYGPSRSGEVEVELRPGPMMIQPPPLPMAHLRVNVKSFRIACGEGGAQDTDTNHTCVFRAYLLHDMPMGSLLQWDETANVYSTQFSLYETDYISTNPKVGLMVVLEELKNKSLVLGHHYEGIEMIRKPSENGKPAMFLGALGERIEKINTHIDLSINNTASLMTTSTATGANLQSTYFQPQLYRKVLSRCRYTAQDYNRFDWVPRMVLERRGFGPKDTLLIPKSNLLPSRNHAEYIKAYSHNQQTNAAVKPLAAYQQYGYFGRTCRQPWISPAPHLESFANGSSSSSSFSLHMVFVGTSRIETIANFMNYFLKPGLQDHWSFATDQDFKISKLSMNVQDQGPKPLLKKLNEHFVQQGLCHSLSSSSSPPPPPPPPDSNKSNTNNQTTLVFFVSFGVWEATYHGRLNERFRFDDTFDAAIQYIQTHCDQYAQQQQQPMLFQYKIVVMTQPTSQAFWGPELLVPETTAAPGPPKPRRNYWPATYDQWYQQKYEILRGSLMQVVNTAIRQTATNRNLTLVDLEAAGIGRPDAASDLVHFFYPGTDPHTRDKIGNDVNVIFAQLALAGMLDAFDFEYD